MNTYDKHMHTHVTFKDPLTNGFSFNYPSEIIHRTDNHIWVMASYADLPFGKEVYGCSQIGDGKSSGYDEDGNCVVAIHLDFVREYLTEEEANSIVECMEADDRLLSYAR